MSLLGYITRLGKTRSVEMQDPLPSNIYPPVGESGINTVVGGNITRTVITHPDGSQTQIDMTYDGAGNQLTWDATRV